MPKKAFIPPFLGLSLLVLGLITSSIQAQSASAYDDCIATIAINPDKALELALSDTLAGTQSGLHCQAVALYEQGAFQAAGDLFTELSDSLGDTPEAADFVKDLTAQAAEAYAADPNSNDRALVWAKRWSKLEPNNIESWFLQADLLSAAGSPDMALFPALQAQTVATANDRARALAVTAGIRLKTGDLSNAQDDLYSALLINDTDPTSLYVLGHWYFAQGDKTNAKEVWQKLEKTAVDENWKVLAQQELRSTQ